MYTKKQKFKFKYLYLHKYQNTNSRNKRTFCYLKKFALRYYKRIKNLCKIFTYNAESIPQVLSLVQTKIIYLKQEHKNINTSIH